MVTVTTLLVLLLTVAGSIHSSPSVPDEAGATDMAALLDLKQAITGDPSAALSSWNRTTPLCRWNGVTCSRRRRVVALNLTGQGLSGPIAASVGNLTALRTLDLSWNHLSSQLPPPLGNLREIQLLNLSNNELTGTIPDTLTNCSKLRRLYLSSNFLVGPIPLEIGLLSNMVGLVLYQNNLTGTIPPTIRNNSQLESLDLGTNRIEGSIPDELGQLSNLTVLALGGNNLSGELPASLLNLTSLLVLDLDTNMLSKTLPPNMGYALPNLQQLFFGVNMFEGQIPATLCNASNLEVIFLNNNNFTGQVPSSIGKLQKLSILNLQDNKLKAWDRKSWDFLYTLHNCSSLDVLSLVRNQLQGDIPHSVGNLSTSLRYLLLGGNYLTGTIPPSIGKLHSLIKLGLNSNNLSGSIEEWIGNLKNLQILLLHENNFTGPIPSSLGNLSQLIELYLQQNGLTGPIPPTIGNLAHLLELNIGHNNLHGNIPREIVDATALLECVLSYNSLDGPIPAEFGNLQQLTTVRFSSNKLSGVIPASLGQCQMLETIQMDQNFLTGNIPTTVGNLKSLSILNLSCNNLSGTIPTALGNLQFLSELNLSYNDLSGEIPINGVFGNATAISLIGNWGLCGGPLNLDMPPCPTVSPRKKMQYYLVRIFIPIFGFLSIILLFHFITQEKKVPSRTYKLLLSFGKQFPKASYRDLVQATGNFSESNLIGKGSYGSVYKGKLVQAKVQVAIKVFDLEIGCADKSFVSECEILRNIRHKNLVPILTACSTIDNVGNPFKALIYELMPNGNLDTWLHHRYASKAPKGLSLSLRICIAANIADALAYLHHDSGCSIVHCDLKPSNILLDADMNAYLGDFGIANLVFNSGSTSVGHAVPDSDSPIGFRGTIGYIAPEYAQCGNASTFGDVYSFGIVLMEMLIGKRPTDNMFEGELNIVNFVQRKFPDQLLHIIDAHIQEECKGFHPMMETESGVHQCLLSLMEVALSCTHIFPKERKNMRETAIKLNAIRTVICCSD